MFTVGYLLLDAARLHGEIHRARELNPDHTCLFEGDSERFLSTVAPWLFSIQPASAFTDWFVSHGSGQCWGVLLESTSEPVRIYKHLRKILVVTGDDGNEMYFRYYDPRVLRVFLPTCEPVQLREFFGPIDAFIAEDGSGNMLEFRMNVDGSLEINETEVDLARYLLPSATSPQPSASESPSPQKRTWDFGY